MSAKELIAKRVAQEFKDGDVVNLGAGLPALVSDYLPKNIRIILHAENGIVGAGPKDPNIPLDEYDVFSTDASEKPVTIIPGGCIVDSATSFGIVRGGHLDATVLGTMQVDADGNIANWLVPGGKMAGMGGAMDLVTGAKRIIVATEHCDRKGNPKILKKCTFPLTGMRVVNSIFTELAYLEVTPYGLMLMETAPKVSVEEIQSKTEPTLLISPNICEMQV